VAGWRTLPEGRLLEKVSYSIERRIVYCNFAGSTFVPSS
jgi:hypothetical protein